MKLNKVMRKIYLFLSSLIVSIFVMAQVEVSEQVFKSPSLLNSDGESIFGYCLEDNYQYLRYKDAGVNGTDVSAAIFISEEIASQLQGNKISKIRIGFNNPARRDITVFIKETLDSNSSVSESGLRLKNVGWNEVELSNPFEITGKSFYVGFSYLYYYNTNVALALVDMKSENKDAQWLKIGDSDWNNTDLSGFGSLLIQIVTTGGKTISFDMGMQDIIVPTSTKSDVDTEISLVARNFGGKDVNGYKIKYTVDGKENIIDVDNIIEPMKTDTVSVLVNVNEPKFGIHNIVATSIANEDESSLDNNTVEKGLIVYGDALPQKKVLVEEYLGMECSACYNVSFHMDTIFNKCNGNVIFMNHHAYKGNKYDCFSLYESVQYSRFFGLTNAPSCALDRNPFNVDGSQTTLLSSIDLLDLGLTANDMLAKDCFTSVDLQTNYNKDTREINIKVSGIKLVPLDGEYPVLQVFLLENGQEMWQNGPGGLKDFVHNHIIRAFVTEPTGYAISGDAGVYEAEFSYTIPEEMCGYAGENGGEALTDSKGNIIYTSPNPENMEVVAVIANFNPDNSLDCKVVNANSCKLGEATVGVGSIVENNMNVYSYGSVIYIDGENQGVEVYSLQGNLVKNINVCVNEINMSDKSNGLYLVRVKTTEGFKVYKLFIK